MNKLHKTEYWWIVITGIVAFFMLALYIWGSEKYTTWLVFFYAGAFIPVFFMIPIRIREILYTIQSPQHQLILKLYFFLTAIYLLLVLFTLLRVITLIRPVFDIIEENVWIVVPFEVALILIQVILLVVKRQTSFKDGRSAIPPNDPFERVRHYLKYNQISEALKEMDHICPQSDQLIVLNNQWHTFIQQQNQGVLTKEQADITRSQIVVRISSIINEWHDRNID